jgi:type IV pilus assembly protein PilN
MMTPINLLPWRELKREKEKKLLSLIGVVSIISAVFVVLLVNIDASRRISNQMIRNQMLQQEIDAYEYRIKKIKHLDHLKKQLLSRMAMIHNLQLSRILTAHLFDELIKVTPSGVFLTKIVGKNNFIILSGYAESNAYVSEEMKNIEHNKWIYNPVLHEIKKRENKNQAANNEFKLRVTLRLDKETGGSS